MSTIMPQVVDNINRSGAVDADELLEVLHGLMHGLRAAQLQALRAGEQPLTPLEARVLGFFARHPGATQRELAEHSGRDKGQLARLVQSLRERGWLEASQGEHDRREVRHRLTERARGQHKSVLRERRRQMESALAGLDAGERAQLLLLLRRLQANLGATA
jgi:DNA-binding MarR family transcriptional regulator